MTAQQELNNVVKLLRSEFPGITFGSLTLPRYYADHEFWLEAFNVPRGQDTRLCERWQVLAERLRGRIDIHLMTHDKRATRKYYRHMLPRKAVKK